MLARKLLPPLPVRRARGCMGPSFYTLPPERAEYYSKNEAKSQLLWVSTPGIVKPVFACYNLVK